MAKVKLAFGYDDERPYGKLAETEAGRALRRKNLAFVQKLVQFFEKRRIPRTFFILGDYLERCLEKFSIGGLRTIYAPQSPLMDIQQHSYSHWPVKPIPEDVNRPIASPNNFGRDVTVASIFIHSILGVKTCGLRTPYGYAEDLSNEQQILKELSIRDIKFVSSWLRGSDGTLEAELTLERQPHTYGHIGYPRLVEIPSHGWQDVIFTKEKARALLNKSPLTQTEIKQYYENLIRRGLYLTEEKSPIYICLCLHPWAVMEYDPDLSIHDYLLTRAQDLGVEIVSYSQIAEEILNSPS